jgi:hypothetical protein
MAATAFLPLFVSTPVYVSSCLCTVERKKHQNCTSDPELPLVNVVVTERKEGKSSAMYGYLAVMIPLSSPCWGVDGSRSGPALCT